MARHMIVALWFVTSASMLLINREAVRLVPVPACVCALQFTACALTLSAAPGARDGVNTSTLRTFAVYCLVFVWGIWCNMKALGSINVETVIVVRACCPLVVSILDWALLGRQAPSARSALALSVLAAGAAGYVAADRQFAQGGWGAYTWVLAYGAAQIAESVAGKCAATSPAPHGGEGQGRHGGRSPFTAPLLTNALSVGPVLCIGALAGELSELRSIHLGPPQLVALAASAAGGALLSVLAWHVRSGLSATTFSVLAVTNKLVTVGANAVVWSGERASATGVLCLLCCLGSAALYQEAPMRTPRAPRKSD